MLQSQYIALLLLLILASPVLAVAATAQHVRSPSKTIPQHSFDSHAPPPNSNSEVEAEATYRVSYRGPPAGPRRTQTLDTDTNGKPFIPDGHGTATLY